MGYLLYGTAEEAVEAIIRDLRDRSGLQNAWDNIDGATRLEIRKRWAELVHDHVVASQIRDGRR